MTRNDEEQNPVADAPPEVRQADEEALTVISNSPASSDVEASKTSTTSTACRRPTGNVCICQLCETTRTKMMRGVKKRARTLEDDEDSSANTSSAPSLAILPATKKPFKAPSPDVTDDTKVGATAAARRTSTLQQQQKQLPNESERLSQMTAACKTILRCIGEDETREGLQKTPERWAKALLFMCSGYGKVPKDVCNGAVFEENHDEMVVVRNIDIHSLCEHHMAPFTGRVHIGYIPNGKILGLSKLARIAELYARRLQVQERLTRQIADAVVSTVQPLGVAVVVECTHFCMVMRGVQKTGAVTTTSSVRGCFESNPKTRAEFFSIIHGNGIKMC